MLPRTDGDTPVPVIQLGNIADRGLVDRDINGGSPRGAFDIESYPSVGKPEFPAIWRHAADAERFLVVRPILRAWHVPGCGNRLSGPGNARLPVCTATGTSG